MTQTHILFICHGNICRSPMAEFVMKKLVSDAGLSSGFVIASAAVSDEETGNPVYPPAKRELAAHGISCAGKTALRMEQADYARYDYLIGMDRDNIRRIKAVCGEDPERKIAMLLGFTDRPREIEDPWYTRRFDAVYSQIDEGCHALLDYILRQGAWKGR